MTTRVLGAAATLLAVVSMAADASSHNFGTQAPASQPLATAVIRGRVTTADTGLPLRRAQVYLNSMPAREAQTTGTDENGRYEFSGLGEGTYTVSATKTGFVRGAFGQRTPSEAGRPIRHDLSGRGHRHDHIPPP
jgi:hypothetical protein